jgi:hypothetical protein
VKLVIKTEAKLNMEISSVYMTFKERKALMTVWLADFKFYADAAEFVAMKGAK